jgi:hypothetical protein
VIGVPFARAGGRGRPSGSRMRLKCRWSPTWPGVALASEDAKRREDRASRALRGVQEKDRLDSGHAAIGLRRNPSFHV